ncbi:hypothetical protein IGI04_024914 [Brassica rapa subsp. trilocularis]|uniref:Uncharacterized protein n=1 Tax=Brassica rapa subsp. trilocularis TaxID=1813537 RepID=A0ABQ7M827_BRACM|nr:hypothetical protein IGI04_024914 [Brassica rapa subsp. trilocularis]
MCGEDNKYEVLEKAGKDLEAMRVQQFSRLVKEFQGNDFWKLWGVIPQEYLRYTTHSSLICNNFVHEYVEAATFVSYVCPEHSLLSMSSISLESADQYPLGCLDSLDLTGELMRMAIARISNGDIKFPQWICQFVREIHRNSC